MKSTISLGLAICAMIVSINSSADLYGLGDYTYGSINVDKAATHAPYKPPMVDTPDLSINIIPN